MGTTQGAKDQNREPSQPTAMGQAREDGGGDSVNRREEKAEGKAMGGEKSKVLPGMLALRCPKEKPTDDYMKQKMNCQQDRYTSKAQSLRTKLIESS